MNKQQLITLLESLLEEPDDQLSIQRINDALTQLNDCDWIVWLIDDVKSVAGWLTDEECREALAYAINEHDAELGINWDSLRYSAERVRKQPKDWSEEDEE